jgi:Mg-chelatase subunit ChlD
MKRTHTTFALSLILGAGIVSPAIACPPDVQVTQEHLRNCPAPQKHQKNVEVVFVLDTTGSMSGLIEGAKQKIWSIASAIAQAQPAPNIRMGLVGYRDRGDQYVTTKTTMTDDLDTVYETLMGFNAGGGGDTPESVNEALFEAVERFDWSDDPNTLKIVFLVGDAPPQMEYKDDVKYQASCKLAAEKGIIVNTIQCGNLHGTKDHWTKIAGLTNGQYAAIDQDSGVQRITTPYDQEITKLDQELAALMIDYGNKDERKFQHSKRVRASTISEDSAPEASADRALYNQTAAGKSNLYGIKELVDDVVGGRVAIEEVEKEQLPEEFQSKTTDELKALIAKNNEQRNQIESRLAELAKLRRAHQDEARASMKGDSFDMQVLLTLEKQGESIGLKITSSTDTDSKDTSKKSSED